ncbi:MotA/TolQ/ExbB proton channel family protein [Phorcysia thermohydrogeniphila]|uniref:Biopolymer transport protein ExbB n=1 Tax=Phorcysia thermohydrogeniphila TaxID=936138 RepID=A0A4R1GPK2_9BACT|nr:MotA/TolQ/ExbB proton channel family protein [Phorcysia thermohydrogeniphila]TCK06402.1 biopolymer transport protein ExbB [Phorcysia thermohydrogeniphila]
MIDLEIVHKGVFFSLYFLFFLASVIFIERLLYFVFAFPAERKLLLKEAEGADERGVEILYHTYVSKLKRGRGVIAFVITASPLLGLLGTVLGIMNSFTTMAERGVSDITAVSKGIAFALQATALGIVIAVVALAYYHVVGGLVRSYETEIKKLILKAMAVSQDSGEKGGQEVD